MTENQRNLSSLVDRSATTLINSSRNSKLTPHILPPQASWRQVHTGHFAAIREVFLLLNSTGSDL